MADEVIESASIEIELNTFGAEQQAEVLGRRIARTLDRATRNAGRQITRNIQQSLRDVDSVAVPARLDMDTINEQLRYLSSSGGALFGRVEIPVTVDEVVLIDSIEDALAGEVFTVRVVADTSGLDRDIERIRPPELDVRVDADTSPLRRALDSLSGIAGRVGKGLTSLLRFSAVGIAAAGAAQGVLALTAALAPAIGIIAAYPAVLIGAKVALGVLKLALTGVQEAFEAGLTGSAEEFEKAIQDLSPAAQSVAREVRALKPAFEELREVAQDAFFGKLTGDITRAAAALDKPLTRAVRNISKQWGEAASSVLRYISSTTGADQVANILNGTNAALSRIDSAAGDVTQGVLSLSSALAKAFGDELGSGIASAADRLGSFLTRAAASGDAVRWVDQALTTFAQLGEVIGNVGEIISGVFNAANTSGGSLLQSLGKITASFSEFVNSAQGQEAIGNIFSTIGTIAAQLGPIISALVNAFGQIAPVLAPVFEALGPALAKLIDVLGPALEPIGRALGVVAEALGKALDAIGPALGPIGEAIAKVLEALSPLLPLIGELAGSVGTILASALGTLAEALAPVISAIAEALIPILPTLTDAFLKLVEALSPLAIAIGEALAQLIEGLAPILPTIADAVLKLVEAFAPLITQLIDELVPILPDLVDIVIQLFEALEPLIPSIIDLVIALTPLLSLVISVIGPLTRFVAGVLSFIAVEGVIPVLEFLVDVITEVVDAVTEAVEFITAAPGKIADALSGIGNDIQTFFTENADKIAEFLVSLPEKLEELGTKVGEFFSGLPERIGTALTNLPGQISELFASIGDLVIQGLTNVAFLAVNAFLNIGPSIGNALAGVPGQVAGFFSNLVQNAITFGVNFVNALAGLPGRIAGFFSDMAQRTQTTVTNWIATISNFFSTLPGKLAAFITSLPGRISGIFSTMAGQAIGRIQGFISSAVGFFQGLPGRIVGALSGLGGRIAGVFATAAGRAREAVSSLISSIVQSFAGLPGRIASSLGNIGARIASSIKSGLPAGIRNLVPFAEGGVVFGPTPALVGEAGPEVIVPLSSSRRGRATQLMEQSGLADRVRGDGGSTGATITNTFVINEVGDAEATANRVLRRMALATSL